MRPRCSKRALNFTGDAAHPPGSTHLEGDPGGECEPTPRRADQQSQGIGIERLSHRNADERQQGKQPRGGARAGEFGGESATVLFVGSQRCGDLSNSSGEAGSVVFGDLPANGERTKAATSGLLRIELQWLDDLVARPGGGEGTWRPARPGEPCAVQGLPRLSTGAKLSAYRRT
jgi:hypothetical protein